MTTNLLLVALFVFCMIIMSLNHGKKKKKIVFLGDNINEMDAKAGGFLSHLINIIREESYEEKYQVSQSIKPGEKVYDLYLRLDENQLLKEADIVIVHIGLNDVLDKYLKGTGTDLETFNYVLKSIITKLQAAWLKVIVCIPSALFDPEFNEIMLLEFATYAKSIKDICLNDQIPFIDLEQAFEYSHATGHDGEEHTNINRSLGKLIWKAIAEVK